MTLDTLIAAGAYLSAGNVDYYDQIKGKHLRLGSVTVDGDLTLTPEGLAFVPSEPVVAEAAPDVEADLDKLLSEDSSAGQ